MKLDLTRFEFTAKSTIGKLLIDGEYFCWILEDPTRDGPKVFGETCIPTGLYKVIVDFSNRFQRRMPHILDVPKFDGIRIHWGNWAVDTQGCLLTGYTRSENYVGNSKRAFDKLFDKLDIAEHVEEPIYIDIVEGAL